MQLVGSKVFAVINNGGRMPIVIGTGIGIVIASSYSVLLLPDKDLMLSLYSFYWPNYPTASFSAY